MKMLYYFLDTILAGIWGLTIIDLIAILSVGSFDIINDSVKVLFAIAGLIYLAVIKIPHEIKMNKLNRKEKKEQIKKLEKENE